MYSMLLQRLLLATWIAKKIEDEEHFRRRRSHVAEHSRRNAPVTIKIRSRSEIERQITSTGFTIGAMRSAALSQNYLPVIGKRHPDGPELRKMADLLGWYHCFICEPN